MSPTPRTDVHTHFLPPAYRQALTENGYEHPDGMPAVPQWSLEAHLELMTKHNITRSIVSISSPGTNLWPNGDRRTAELTRQCNAYAADLKKRMPDRFGYFATLPIPDVSVCLEEIKLASDEGCDGFVMLTNGHGHYLGDPSLDRVFEELNKRKAILFIHPTTPCIKCAPGQSRPTQATPFGGRMPNPMFEFLFDTTRAIINLFMSGTIARCPDLRIILPHLGGASPPLLSRWTTFSVLAPTCGEQVTEDTAREAYNRQFWFDLAGMPFPGQIKGLMEGNGVKHNRLLYGSDFPYSNAGAVSSLTSQMDKGMQDMFSEDQIADMYHRNAEKLLG